MDTAKQKGTNVPNKDEGEIEKILTERISSALREGEEDQQNKEVRAKLEHLFETKEHPKRDILWNLASDLSTMGYEETEDLYSRLVMLIR